MSVGPFVSVQGDESQDTPPSTEAAVAERCGNAEDRNLASSEAQKTKSGTPDFDRLSTGSNCSDSSRRRQQSWINRLKRPQLKLERESKRIKKQVEQYQSHKEEKLHQRQEKIQLLELEGDLRQCGGESDRANVDYF